MFSNVWTQNQRFTKIKNKVFGGKKLKSWIQGWISGQAAISVINLPSRVALFLKACGASHNPRKCENAFRAAAEGLGSLSKTLFAPLSRYRISHCQGLWNITQTQITWKRVSHYCWRPRHHGWGIPRAHAAVLQTIQKVMEGVGFSLHHWLNGMGLVPWYCAWLSARMWYLSGDDRYPGAQHDSQRA